MVAAIAPPASQRPWGRALLWLALLAPLFFVTYGFANAMAARHAAVGVVAFDWERAIPFWPWTIVPYWSIDAFYGLSLLVCATRRELDTHAWRLLTAQVICVGCFLVFPLRFSFERPATRGLFGWMFDALMGFDKPFNQAPSLHICLLVILWVLYARHLPRAWKPVLHGWAALIGLSVLTTYQHHFFDVPTGLVAGALCLWLWPDDRPSPLTRLKRTRDRTRRRLATRYLVGAAICLVPALVIGGAALWLLWPALSLLLVALAYAAVGPDAFQKQADGRMSLAALMLFAPYRLGAWINSRLWTRRARRPVRIADDVWLGRLPDREDLIHDGIEAVVDLCAELPPPKVADYQCIPVLDLVAPSPSQLAEAARAIEAAQRRGHRTLVCCALGYSRSASAVIAWLIDSERAANLATAIAILQRSRPTVVLTAAHFSALQAFAADRIASPPGIHA